MTTGRTNDDSHTNPLRSLLIARACPLTQECHGPNKLVRGYRRKAAEKNGIPFLHSYETLAPLFDDNRSSNPQTFFVFHSSPARCTASRMSFASAQAASTEHLSRTTGSCAGPRLSNSRMIHTPFCACVMTWLSNDTASIGAPNDNSQLSDIGVHGCVLGVNRLPGCRALSRQR